MNFLRRAARLTLPIALIATGAFLISARRVEGATAPGRQHGHLNPSVSHVAGDLDGDGKPDDLLIKWPNPEEQEAILFARMTRLGTQRVRFWYGCTERAPQIYGTVDIDGDGRDEVLVDNGAGGASTRGVALFRVVAGKLKEVTLDGKPASLSYGGSVMHFDALGCGTGTLVLARYWCSPSDDPDISSCGGERRRYRLDGAALVLVEATQHEFARCNELKGRCPANQELEDAGYTVTCGPMLDE